MLVPWMVFKTGCLGYQVIHLPLIFSRLNAEDGDSDACSGGVG